MRISDAHYKVSFQMFNCGRAEVTPVGWVFDKKRGFGCFVSERFAEVRKVLVSVFAIPIMRPHQHGTLRWTPTRQ
ncbi:hypothetical protein, partial [Aeromonas schubertii]|uniref:hypothetical protein n=1 Tax=Aeromonas schubertii TaxID=652 RepID=UPI001CC36D06